MFELTDAASQELNAYFDGNEKSPIRVFLAPGGCSGPRLALALDTPNDDDMTFDVKDLSFCMNKELYEAAKNVTIEFSDMGFNVASDLQLGGGGCSPSCCSSCGSGCSS